MEKRKQMDIIIGNNMAAIRKSREYKQREICQVLGMNASTYKHYELGDRCVRPSVLKALANFYKIHVDYFFENVPESDDIREHLFFTNYGLDAVESKGIEIILSLFLVFLSFFKVLSVNKVKLEVLLLFL